MSGNFSLSKLLDFFTDNSDTALVRGIEFGNSLLEEFMTEKFFG
jgi:hypothetical protein